MNLLKLGPLNLDGYRWIDALDVFDHIDVVALKNESIPEVEDDRIRYHYVERNLVNNLVLGGFVRISLQRANLIKFPKFLETVLRGVFRHKNRRLIKEIEAFDYDEVHVSYNDFDESGMLEIMLHPIIASKRITRAYKETRVKADPVELRSFELADRIVLNTESNIEFFEQKYGDGCFREKDIVTGLDEDYLSRNILSLPLASKKLSEADGRGHVVILTGRAASDQYDERGGARIYYVPLIDKLLAHGFAVHLHAMEILKDRNGNNQYLRLKEVYPDTFFIEDPLDFSEDNAERAYTLLSRYDYGVLHNFIEGTSVSEFDKYNIPHRFYKYTAANVIPLLEKGKTVVLQRLIEQTRSGCLYESYSDIDSNSSFVPLKASFSDYISALYG